MMIVFFALAAIVAGVVHKQMLETDTREVVVTGEGKHIFRIRMNGHEMKETLDPLPYHKDCFAKNVGTKPKASDIALSTYCDISKLDRLVGLAQRWDGPVSAAIYVNAGPDSIDAADTRLKVGKALEQITTPLTIVFVYALAKTSGYFEYDYVFPSNALRNAAMDGVQQILKSPFTVILDVDFVPSSNANEMLKKTQPYLSSPEHAKDAIVLAPFAFPDDGREDAWEKTPRNKDALTPKTGPKAVNFYSSQYHKKRKNLPNVAEVDGWRKMKDGDGDRIDGHAFEVQYRDMFEPYVMMRTDSIPRCDERFRFRGKNKMAFDRAIHEQGGKFFVVLDAFVFHRNHPRSHLKHPPSKESGVLWDVSQPYNDFVQQLKDPNVKKPLFSQGVVDMAVFGAPKSFEELLGE